MFTVHHPVEWPATASLPGVVNMIEKSKLAEDFFAQSSQESPAIIFQKLLFFLSYVFNHDPMKAMVLLGCIVSFLYFPLFFLVTQKGLENLVVQLSINEHLKKLMRMISLVFTLLLFLMVIFFQDDINSRFTNMMWPPIFINPNAYIISMLVGISGALVSVKHKYGCVMLISISCLLHPAMGLFTSIFCFLLINNFSSKGLTVKNFTIFFTPVLAVYICLFIYYPQTGMSGRDFVDIYIYQRHPHHYLISASFDKKQWMMILGVLFVEASLLLYTKNKIWINSILALTLLVLIPIIHYLFTEIYQSKIVAMFGFTRFFMFAIFLIIYFGLALFLSLLKFRHQYWKWLSRMPIICERATATAQSILIGSAILFVVAGVLLINYVHRELIFLNNSVNEFNIKHKNILSMISDSSVVMALNGDEFIFGLFGKKNLYSTDAFPHSESRFQEYAKRRLIFEKCNKHLSFISLAEAKNKYKLDYVLMEKEKLPLLQGAMVVAEDGNLVLIDVDGSLKRIRQ